jgi:hypothetical protein
MSRGQVTFSIMSMFRNLSATINFKNPKMELAVSRIDLNGDMRIKAPGLRFAAR